MVRTSWSRNEAPRRRRLLKVVGVVAGVLALGACEGDYFLDPSPMGPSYDNLGTFEPFIGGGNNPFGCPNGQIYSPPINDYSGGYACRPQPDRPPGFWAALLVLQLSADCNSLVGGGATDAKAVLWNVAGAGRITQASAQSPEHPNAIASAGPLGSGANGHITLYPKFFDSNVWANENVAFPFAFALKVQPTMLLWQALTLLHEVGHLTGANDHGRYEGGIPFDNFLLDRCFQLKA